MHLFLSPHLDDAALSCGGTIHHLTSRGEAVTILTIMAGDPPVNPDTPFIRELHARWDLPHDAAAQRRAEDRAAAAALGAKVIHWAIPDCIYRETGAPLYPSVEDIFGDVQPSDAAIAALDAEAVTLLEQFPAVTALYGPLGVGHHVDHLIVRDWVLGLAARLSLALALYEEYPYTRDRDAIQRALREMPDDRPLIARVQPLTAPEVDAKVRAIACYQSQISTFWPDVDAMAHEVRQITCGGAEGCVERYRDVQHTGENEYDQQSGA